MNANIRPWAMGIILLCSAICGAEKYVHNFHDMSGGAIAFSGGSKVGTTDLTTYTCYRNAIFSYHATKTSNKICIFMESQNDSVIIAPPIANLDSMVIYYMPNANKAIDVYVSTDGVHWGEKQTVKYESAGQRKTIQFPAKGNYYLKIVNPNGSNAFYISEIDYITKPCHCLRVVTD